MTCLFLLLFFFLVKKRARLAAAINKCKFTTKTSNKIFVCMLKTKKIKVKETFAITFSLKLITYFFLVRCVSK